jgi:hypothetical protein
MIQMNETMSEILFHVIMKMNAMPPLRHMTVHSRMTTLNYRNNDRYYEPPMKVI